MSKRSSAHAQVLLIVAEVGELAAAKADWQSALCDHIRSLTGATMGVVGEVEGWDGLGVPRPVRVTDRGLSPAARVHFVNYLNDPTSNDPFLEYVAKGPRVPCTLVRRDAVPDSAWYASPYVQKYRLPAGVDDMMLSIVAPRGTNAAIALGAHLERSQGYFSAKARGDLALLQQALQGWSRLLLPQRETSPVLTPRLASMLQHLANGLTERQAASKMGISEHTAHMHTRRLYKALGVSSRAQVVHVALSQNLVQPPAAAPKRKKP